MSGPLPSGLGIPEYGGGGGGHPGRGPGHALAAGLASLFKLLLYAATVALAAGAVSYYFMSVQLPRETAPLRDEMALIRQAIETTGPTGPGAEEPATGSPRMDPDPGPGVLSPGGGSDVPAPAPPPPAELRPEVRECLLKALALLAGQSQIAVAIGDVARHDWGAAAVTAGQAAAIWESSGSLGELASQARECQAQLALGDIRGAARLRLLWHEVQFVFSAEMARLEKLTAATP